MAKGSGHAPGPGPPSVALYCAVPDRGVLALPSHSPLMTRADLAVGSENASGQMQGWPRDGWTTDSWQGAGGAPWVPDCSESPSTHAHVRRGPAKGQGLRCPRKRKVQQSSPTGQDSV